MGRVKDLKELGKRGPGRKAKKQPDPEVPVQRSSDALHGRVKKRTGGRIMQRGRKRIAKVAVQQMLKKEKKTKKSSTQKETPTEEGAEFLSDEGTKFLPEDLVDVSSSRPFSDNKSLLRMVNKEGSDGNSDGRSL